MPKYKIAGVIFETNHIYGYTPKLCEKYVYTGEKDVEITFKVTDEDILKEKNTEGGEEFPLYYLESLALFRKLCEYVLVNRQGIIFHSSAIAVDGEAYLFTAPSGTGKSTHTRFWRELLGDKAIMVNDDKPIIRLEDGDFYVYGTPWNGKHKLDTDTRVKIKAICHLVRGEKNYIEELSAGEMLMVILNQTIRPEEVGELDKLFAILDKLLRTVKLYRLHCTASIEAAKVSYNKMVKGE